MPYKATNTKKFLDSRGLTYFSQQLNNYPDNTVIEAVVEGVQDALDEKLDAVQKGAANGVAPLDAAQKVPLANLSVMTGATNSAAGTSGLVPSSNAGDQNKFLKASGEWGIPAGTSIHQFVLDDMTNATGLYSHTTSLSAARATMKAVNIECSNPDAFLDAITITINNGSILLECNKVNGSSSILVTAVEGQTGEQLTVSQYAEIIGKIGDITSLTTANKDSLTAAVNEIDSAQNIISAQVTNKIDKPVNVPEGKFFQTDLNGNAVWGDAPSSGDISNVVTNVEYDSSLQKITKTINGTTGDVIDVSTLKSAMNLNNVENKTSATIRQEITNSNVTAALGYTPIDTRQKGASHGVAELGEDGKILASQLPSYVDDVLEYPTTFDFPFEGEAGKIYVETSTNKTYRWSGSTYVEITSSVTLGETSSTAYRGDRGKAAYDHASAKGSAFTSGLYKITTNSEGHVTNAAAVTKSDITDLGIPSSDTNTTYTLSQDSTDKHKITLTPSSGTETTITLPDQDTHRPVQINGTEILGNNTTPLNLKAGSNVGITNTNGTVTITATDTTYLNKEAVNEGTDVSLVTTGEKYSWNNKTSNEGTVTSVAAGAGLAGGPITSTGTLKADLVNETRSDHAATEYSGSNGNLYPVRLDSNGKLSVVIPPSPSSITYTLSQDDVDGHIITFTPSNGSPTTITIPDNDSDTKVTSAANHYVPITDIASDMSSIASGGTASWNADVVQGVTLNTDGKGHVTGISVTSGKIPANPNTDENVTQTATTTNAAYEVLFSATDDNTTRTEGTGKTDTLTYNPSTKALLTGGSINGYLLRAASAKNVDDSISSSSTSENLPTSQAVASFVNSAVSGFAELDGNGKVLSSQLPSYVDDVLEFEEEADFPATGEAGKIYIDLSSNKTYRWSGSAYVEISASLALGETSSTAYRGDRGKTAYDHANAKGNEYASGLYKITTNPEGHVTNAVAVGKADITALGIPEISDIPTNVSDLTNDAGYLTQHQDISGKVDAVEGKGLSTNDYTTAEKEKLAGIAAGATANVVENSLSSTSTTSALSAAQGKALNDTVNKIAESALLGNFNSKSALDTYLDTLLSGMRSNEVRSFAVDCNGAFDLFANGISYVGTIYKSGSNTTYSHVNMRVIGGINEIQGYRTGNGWSYESLRSNFLTVNNALSGDDLINNQSDKDLNHYITTKAWRIGNVSRLTNGPVWTLAGAVGNLYVRANGIYVSQTFIGNAGLASRTSADGGSTWNDWAGYALKNDIDTLTSKFDPYDNSAISDCNALMSTGRYKAINSTVNTPFSSHFVIDVIAYSSSEVSQIAKQVYSSRTFARGTADGGATWSAWEELALNSKIPNFQTHATYTYSSGSVTDWNIAIEQWIDSLDTSNMMQIGTVQISGSGVRMVIVQKFNANYVSAIGFGYWTANVTYYRKIDGVWSFSILAQKSDIDTLNSKTTPQLVTSVPFQSGIFECSETQTIGDITIPTWSIYNCKVRENDGVATVINTTDGRMWVIAGSHNAWSKCVSH